MGGVPSEAQVLADKAEAIAEDNLRWARRVTRQFFWLRGLSTFFAALAIVAGALPSEIAGVTLDKWIVAVPVALSAAVFLFVGQLKLPERANVHYRRADLLNFLALRIRTEGGCDVSEALQRFEQIMVDTSREFERINEAFTKPLPRLDHAR